MLKTFYSQNFQEAISGQFVFIDNDCLAHIYDHAILLKELTGDFGLKNLYIHPFVEFEFLRNTPVLEIKLNKQKFIESPLFAVISQRLYLEHLPNFITNALLLSKIYVQEKYSGASSFVDLVLAGMLMAAKNKGVMLTGNRKDFPACVFDTLATINLEFDQENHKVIYALAFNKEKFEKCNDMLKEADYKQAKKLITEINQHRQNATKNQ